MEDSVLSQLESQLEVVHLEKELLEQEIGTSDPATLVFILKNMEEQLLNLYQKKEGYLSVKASNIQIKTDSLVFFKESQLIQ